MCHFLETPKAPRKKANPRRILKADKIKGASHWCRLNKQVTEEWLSARATVPVSKLSDMMIRFSNDNDGQVVSKSVATYSKPGIEGTVTWIEVYAKTTYLFVKYFHPLRGSRHMVKTQVLPYPEIDQPLVLNDETRLCSESWLELYAMSYYILVHFFDNKENEAVRMRIKRVPYPRRKRPLIVVMDNFH